MNLGGPLRMDVVTYLTEAMAAQLFVCKIVF